ncbi:MAG: protein kinase [Scytolyngbya sp. HA4215-MV1]|jgi:serine/threonine-protein kinase|nr:protein kinase [Scytolyngbya sp. HA4215-MV1]
MDIHCTRPGCLRPLNHFADLDSSVTLKTVQQKYCISCGMPLILIGRYLPQKLLGQGGFGAAFLARDRYTPGMRQCVVKQFQPSGKLSANQLQLAQQLFEREAEVLEELGNAHPQIPDLFAFFELAVPNPQGADDRFFYLVQEFIDGLTMEEELAQKGAFSEAKVLEVLENILPVLKFVHENGSIHRDIKLSNIMRHRNGKLYLLDFGAVKQATKGGRPAGSGSTGIYSLGFAPPEQVSGGEVYPSTDLYALAVTCIVLLTGKEPNELFESYRNAWNWQNFAQVSPKLAGVLDRMLLPTPSDRFHSAGEVLTALKQPGISSMRPVVKPAGKPVIPRPSSGVAQSAVQSSGQPSSVPPTVAPSTPPTVMPANPAPAHQVRSAIVPLSTLELLGSAAFTGFEAGLLAIGLTSFLGTTVLSGGFWLLLLTGLIFLQSRRWIEKLDLLIFAATTLALVVLIPGLHTTVTARIAGSPQQIIVVVSVLMSLLAIAITALFRLLYKLFATFF